MKSKFILISTIFLILLWLIACASVKPTTRDISASEHVYVKNYKIGEAKKIYIGEELIKVKDYYLIKSSQNKLEALDDFEIKMPFHQHRGYRGDVYQIQGMSKTGNVDVYLVRFSTIPQLRFGISKEGYWAHFIIDNSNAILHTLFVNFKPEKARFKKIMEEKVDKTRGFTNYEIVFTGITEEAINILYREYTSDDIARPAFYQNLVYPNDSKTIRFKKIKISINEITNEGISYTVLQDGLSK